MVILINQIISQKQKPQEIKIPDFKYCPILGIRYYFKSYYVKI